MTAGLLPAAGGRLARDHRFAGGGEVDAGQVLAETCGAVVVPMDGFHLADVELARRGCWTARARRRPSTGGGTPRCCAGSARARRRLGARAGLAARQVVMAPMFERDLEQPIAGAIPVPPSAAWS